MATWNDSLKIGVPLIDLQHEQLFDQMDLLLVAVKAKKDLKQITNILKFLKMYVNNHFGYEEQCMHLHQCPAAAQNQSAHSYFTTRLTEIEHMVNTSKSPEVTADKITHELINWFINHIRSIDNQLGRCIQ
jgi:hemerythrin